MLWRHSKVVLQFVEIGTPEPLQPFKSLNPRQPMYVSFCGPSSCIHLARNVPKYVSSCSCERLRVQGLGFKVSTSWISRYLNPKSRSAGWKANWKVMGSYNSYNSSFMLEHPYLHPGETKFMVLIALVF